MIRPTLSNSAKRQRPTRSAGGQMRGDCFVQTEIHAGRRDAGTFGVPSGGNGRGRRGARLSDRCLRQAAGLWAGATDALRQCSCAGLCGCAGCVRAAVVGVGALYAARAGARLSARCEPRLLRRCGRCAGAERRPLHRLRAAGDDRHCDRPADAVAAAHRSGRRDSVRSAGDRGGCNRRSAPAAGFFRGADRAGGRA